MRKKKQMSNFFLILGQNILLILFELFKLYQWLIVAGAICGWCDGCCWLEMMLAGAGANLLLCWLGLDDAASEWCGFWVVLAVDVDVHLASVNCHSN